MEQPVTLIFLQSFFNLFDAKIEDIQIIENRTFGIAVWQDDEEKQNFVFTNNFDESLLSKTKSLCDFILKYNLIEGDRIIVSELELTQKLINERWSEFEAKKAIDCLCNLEAKMIDEGEETDSFFVHF